MNGGAIFDLLSSLIANSLFLYRSLFFFFSCFLSTVSVSLIVEGKDPIDIIESLSDSVLRSESDSESESESESESDSDLAFFLIGFEGFFPFLISFLLLQ